MSNVVSEHRESVFLIHAHRLARYERRLLREGLQNLAQRSVPLILPSIDDEHVDTRALVDLGGATLPSLYRRTEQLRTQVQIESMQLARGSYQA